MAYKQCCVRTRLTRGEGVGVSISNLSHDPKRFCAQSFVAVLSILGRVTTIASASPSSASSHATGAGGTNGNQTNTSTSMTNNTTNAHPNRHPLPSSPSSHQILSLHPVPHRLSPPHRLPTYVNF